MLKLGVLPVITKTVTLRLPFEGEVKEQDFTVTMRVLPISRGSEDTVDTEAAQRALLSEAIVDLDGVVDGNEQPIAYDPQLFDLLFDRIEVRAGLLRAYFEARAEAARGN